MHHWLNTERNTRPWLILGLLLASGGSLEAADTPGHPAFPGLDAVRRCYAAALPANPVEPCDRAFRYWVRRRVFCPGPAFGGDYILVPEGTVRHYVRTYADGSPDLKISERVEKLVLPDRPGIEIWARRIARGRDTLSSYLVEISSGTVMFESLHAKERTVTCRKPEIYLPGSPDRDTSWTGSGCWLTDSISGAVYPHTPSSVFQDLLLPGSVVRWSYRAGRATEATKVPAGEYAAAMIKRMKVEGSDPGSAEYEEVFARGVGRIRGAARENGAQAWTEQLAEITYPDRPTDLQQLCRPSGAQQF
jgi:hypothetical protein